METQIESLLNVAKVTVKSMQRKSKRLDRLNVIARAIDFNRDDKFKSEVLWNMFKLA